MKERAFNEVLTEYVVENANLKLVIKQLQLEIEELKKVKEPEEPKVD